MSTTTLDDPTGDTADTEAPYGRKPDGTPYKIPPDHPFRSTEHKARSTTATKRTKGKGGPRSPRPTRRGSSSSSRAPDYTDAVAELVRLAAIPLVLLAPVSPAFKADAVAVTQAADPIGAAVNDLAQDNPQLAATLERLADVGPYAALFAAVIPLGVQIATNHGLVAKPLGIQLGATDPDELAGAVDAEARRLDDELRKASEDDTLTTWPPPGAPAPNGHATTAPETVF